VPYVALLTSAAIGLVLVFGLSVVQGEDADVVAAKLLNIAVFGAVIAYVLQMAAFLLLRQRFPNVSRPYISPVGVVGAVVAGVIAVLTLIILPFNADYRGAISGVAIFYLIGVLYFALVGRNRLVLSPEEEYALTGGLHGHPETEGYDVTEQIIEHREDRT
jgi:ethanolamine permease